MLLAVVLACGSAEPASQCMGWVDPSYEDSGLITERQHYLTWDNYGEPFFQTWCQSCHSRTTPQRLGAPERMNFDIPEDIVTWKEAIFSSVIVGKRMPKGGGLSDVELSKLEHYLGCLGDANEDGL